VIGWKRRERPAVLKGLELLTNLGLREKADQLAGTLSGGERRLLEVARALMAEPSVLLLDEPTAGVHDVLIERLERHIREIVDAGVTVVLVEHELGVVERLCDSIVMMANGSVLGEAASLVELSNDPAVVDAYFG
jgi:branched-chain amino acid transport system ATP-binding protein